MGDRGSHASAAAAAASSTPAIASSLRTRSSRAGLNFPVGLVCSRLKAGAYSQRVGGGAPVYVAAVLEYLATELLDLAGHAAELERQQRSGGESASGSESETRRGARMGRPVKTILPAHIEQAIRSDGELHRVVSDMQTIIAQHQHQMQGGISAPAAAAASLPPTAAALEDAALESVLQSVPIEDEEEEDTSDSEDDDEEEEEEEQEAGEEAEESQDAAASESLPASAAGSVTAITAGHVASVPSSSEPETAEAKAAPSAHASPAASSSSVLKRKDAPASALTSDRPIKRVSFAPDAALSCTAVSSSPAAAGVPVHPLPAAALSSRPTPPVPLFEDGCQSGAAHVAPREEGRALVSMSAPHAHGASQAEELLGTAQPSVLPSSLPPSACGSSLVSPPTATASVPSAPLPPPLSLSLSDVSVSDANLLALCAVMPGVPVERCRQVLQEQGDNLANAIISMMQAKQHA